MVRSLYAGVEPRPLLIVLAAVFAGLATVLTVAAAVTGTWLVLLAAVPLALTAGLMWYQGTGRLAASLVGGGTRRRRRQRTRRTAVGDPSNTGSRQRGGTTVAGTAREEGTAAGTAREEGDPWEDHFREEVRREARTRARRGARSRVGRRAGAAREDGAATAGVDGAWRNRQRADRLDGLTRGEAYDVLGLDPTASEAAVRSAYREKAKELHPDTEGGSAEAFQELNDAYERLVDD